MKPKNPILLLAPVVFLCGASLMALELTASRILAPYLGGTFYIWTSIIGIIMLSLSLGYWLGGILADKKANFSVFSIIIFASSIFAWLIYLTQQPTLEWLSKNIPDLRAASVMASMALFFIPSLILGMVSPYAAKLALKNIQNSGKTVGNLYALSTFGSIAGTFLAGFWLIPSYGTKEIIIIIACTLFVTSLFGPLKLLFVKIFIAALFFFLFSLANPKSVNLGFQGSAIADIDTMYSRIIVADSLKDGEQVRHMITEQGAAQSGIFLNRNDELLFEYTKYYELASVLSKNKNLLMVGGGAFVYPSYHLKKYSDSKIDVVEIDPKLTEIAKKYFNFEPNDRLSIFNEDGRIFLNKNKKVYDAVLMDAFKSYSPPFQLTTEETLQNVKNSLSDGGVYIANLISSKTGRNSDFLCAEVNTTKTIFPEVLVFQAYPDYDPEALQNFVVVAFRQQGRELPSDSQFAGNLLDKELISDLCKNQNILTDDHAPVETMLSV